MIQFLKMEKEAAELNLDFDQIAVDEAAGEGDTIDLGQGVSCHSGQAKRDPESRIFIDFWIPAFAGMTD
jgi:hypothetical protein